MLSFKNPEIKNLPFYSIQTLARITITYIISLAVGLFFGIMAALNKTVAKILVPIFDIGQSIPILGYFPAAVLFLITLFHGQRIGLELAAIFLLFTSMEWAIFFGVIGAVKSIPANVVEAAKLFGFKGFDYIRHVIIPAITPALIAASTLAWGDGWFFMIASEYISYGGKNYALPGLGAYLARAAYEYDDLKLSIALLILITTIVIFINHFTWHKLAEKANVQGYRPLFKFPSFHFPKFYLRHHIFPSIRLGKYSKIQKVIKFTFLISAVLLPIVLLYHKIPSRQVFARSLFIPELWHLPAYIGFTMTRLLVAYLISLLIAIIIGILAAENQKFGRFFFPLYDIGQSVPILALFPVIFIWLSHIFGGNLGLEITAVVMLVADMIWYLFLNIVSAIRTIPKETKEVGRLFGLKGWPRIRHIILPSIVPAIVTGSMLSWATGWNTVIFAEYMPYGRQVFSLQGLGSFLDQTAYKEGNTILLLFLLIIISSIVILMEKFIWKKLLAKSEKYETIEL